MAAGMTPSEAGLKWCPMFRVSVLHGDETINNRGDFMAHGASCIGPACMAWRWDTTSKVTGYCGLAKEPNEHFAQ